MPRHVIQTHQHQTIPRRTLQHTIHLPDAINPLDRLLSFRVSVAVRPRVKERDVLPRSYLTRVLVIALTPFFLLSTCNCYSLPPFYGLLTCHVQRELTHTITLHPSYFGAQLEEFLKQKLYEDVEGTCSGKHG